MPEEVERDEGGYVLTGRDLAQDASEGWNADRQPLLLETSMPGVFATGDRRHGSVKRMASTVGEESIAIQMVHEYINLLVAPAA